MFGLVLCIWKENLRKCKKYAEEEYAEECGHTCARSRAPLSWPYHDHRDRICSIETRTWPPWPRTSSLTVIATIAVLTLACYRMMQVLANINECWTNYSCDQNYTVAGESWTGRIRHKIIFRWVQMSFDVSAGSDWMIQNGSNIGLEPSRIITRKLYCLYWNNG